MRQFMQLRGSARPMMGPNAAAQPQVIRPNVEAVKYADAATGDVAKIRHLRQAAEHLAGAGLAEYAAKARAEADRMTAALKADILSLNDAEPLSP